MAKTSMNTSSLIHFLSNSLMKQGKKRKFAFLFRLFQDSLSRTQHAFFFLFLAYRLRPLAELKSTRKGSKFYFFPAPFLDRNRSLKMGLRFLKKRIRSRREYTLEERVRGEVRDLFQEKGSAWAWRHALRKACAQHMIYAHYRWR